MILAKIELTTIGERAGLSVEDKEFFGINRLKLYAYLAMLAPQEVIDANDNLIDILLALVYDGKRTDWVTIRAAALNLTNAMRADIGLDKEPVTYNGAR